jgi:hypothetical protein
MRTATGKPTAPLPESWGIYLRYALSYYSNNTLQVRILGG